MATLTGAVQLALLNSYTPTLDSGGIKIYDADGAKYEFVDTFANAPGSDYVVIADGVSRVFLRDAEGASIIVGNDNTYIHSESVSAGNKVIVGDGSNVISLSDGDNAVRVGTGNNKIDTGDGDDSITAGNGNNIIVTGNGNDRVIVGNGNNIIDTGSGNDNVVVGNGNNFVFTGAGEDTIKVTGNGAGANRIDAGAGNDTIILASGNGVDTIVKGSASGEVDQVTNFNAGASNTNVDHIVKPTSQTYTVATVDGNAVITFADGSKVVLVGVTASNIDDSDFVTS